MNGRNIHLVGVLILSILKVANTALVNIEV